MVSALLLTGLFILLVLGLLMTVVYYMLSFTDDTIAKGTPGQQRFLTTSILNYLVQLEE